MNDAENIRALIMLVSAVISLISALIAYSALRLNRTNLRMERSFKAPYLLAEILRLQMDDTTTSTHLIFDLKIENAGERPADGIVYEYQCASKVNVFEKKEQLANTLPRGKSITIHINQRLEPRILRFPVEFTIFLRVSCIDKFVPGDILENVFAYKWQGNLGNIPVAQANTKEAVNLLQTLHPTNWQEFSDMIKRVTAPKWPWRIFRKT